MEVHQTLRKVTEQSLTLQDCRFFLSKTGQKQSRVIFENYCKKYHPKNSSLTSYFNKKVLQFIGPFNIKRKQQSRLKQSKVYSSMVNLPRLRNNKNGVYSDKWQRIIRMTQKQNIIRKGCEFPRIINRNGS